MPNLHQRQGEGTPVGNRELKTSPEELARRKEKYVLKSGVSGRGRYLKQRTHCAKGHPFSGPNLIIEMRTRSDGLQREVRRCRICVRANASETRLKNLEEHRRLDRDRTLRRRNRVEAQAVMDGEMDPDLFMDLLILDLKSM